MNIQIILNILNIIALVVFFNEIKRSRVTLNLEPNVLRTVSWNG